VTVRAAAGRLVNVATRAPVTAGEATTIAGFVLQGDGPRTVLIRGAGPALGGFGVGEFLPDPQLELFQGASRLAVNDDWNAADADRHARAGAFPFATGSRDAALVATLAPGAYTVLLRPAGVGAATGVGLVEVFELTEPGEPDGATRLANLSTRALVGTGQNILIPGLVLRSDGDASPRPLLVRAVGPGLAEFGVGGVLARPQLRILDAGRVVLAENIGWQSAPERSALLAASAAVGAFPLAANRADSALLLALPPGAYTLQVSGADGGSGIVLVEVYAVP